MNFIRWALIREQFVDITFGNNTDSHNVSNQMDDNGSHDNWKRRQFWNERIEQSGWEEEWRRNCTLCVF